MEHLFLAWPEIVPRLRSARRILTLMDYDGTLTPIVAQPELADLPEETRRFLEALACHRRIILGVISGRVISDLKTKINVDGIIYSGNHGLEIEAPEVRLEFPLAEEIQPELNRLYEILLGAVGGRDGVFVENKTLSLSVHYRQVKKGAVREVKRAFEQAISAAQLSNRLKITTGKKVFEVRPAGWHKGKVIELLMERFGEHSESLLPVYLGDDRADEDAFRAIRGKGISVFVGGARRRSAARYFLHSPAEVGTFLGMLLKEA